MRTFKDSMGREWTLKVSVLAIERVRAGLDGLDLPSLFDEKLEGLAALLEDTCKLARTITYLVEKQLAERKMTADELVESLECDALKDAGDALCWAISDFFPEARRTASQAMLRKLSAIESEMKKQAGIAIKTMDEADVEKIVRERWGLKPGSLSGDAPEFSGSTPDPSPSAN